MNTSKTMQVRENGFIENSTLSTTFKQSLEARYGPGISEQFRSYEKTRIKLTKEEEHISFLREARDKDLIPKGFQLKAPFPGDRAKHILNNASKALIRLQINYHRWKKSTLETEAVQRYEEIKDHTSFEDYEPIFNKIEHSCNRLRENLRRRHQGKLQRIQPNSRKTKTPETQKTIINTSERLLTAPEEQLLSRGLNFAISSKEIPSLDIIASVEALNLPSTQADELRHQIRTTLEKSKKPVTNISKDEEKILRGLQKDKSIKILPADKGNATVVMDVESYNQKIDDVLSKGNYKLLSKDPTPTIERRIYRILKKYERYIPDAIRTKLTPHHSKPPHLYGLPKIHKANMPLRPITSSRDSATSALSKYLLDILRPLEGKTESFVKNSKYFVDILKNVNLSDNDKFVSFDVESLYTNVPIDESLNVIRQKLGEDESLLERTELPLDGIMELLECCLRSSYFQVKDRFYAQDDGLPMGSSLSPVVANLFMEWFESHAIETAVSKPKLWLRYVDDTFIIWTGNDRELADFLEHLNSIRTSIKFTMEIEQNSCLPFLDVLVRRTENNNICTTVYRKPTHTGQYLHNKSNHSDATKRGIIKTLYNRAVTLCSDSNELNIEILNIKKDLQQNGYSEKLISETINNVKTCEPRIQSSLDETTKYLTIPYVKGISEKIRRLTKPFNIKTSFKSENTLRSSLTRTKPEGSGSQKDCIYQIPCECGSSYIGETKRPLTVRLKEHKNHTQRGETTKSGIAEHVWSNQHRVQWSQAKVLHREPHWRKRKFIESAFMSQNQGIFSNPSIEVPNIWKPLLVQDKKLRLHGSLNSSHLVARN